MSLKSTFSIVFSFIVVMTSPKSVHSLPTKWEDANISMTDLLNSGWQVTGHGISRVAASQSAISSGFDERLFTFMLTNGRKHVICISANPKPPIASASDCRKLN